jgi:hypothetical protein
LSHAVVSPYRTYVVPLSLSTLVVRPGASWIDRARSAALVLTLLVASIAVGAAVSTGLAPNAHHRSSRVLPKRRADPHRTPSARGEADPAERVDDADIVRELGVKPPAQPIPLLGHRGTHRDD